MSQAPCLFLRIEDLEPASGSPYRALWQLHDQKGQYVAGTSAAQTLSDILSSIPAAAKKHRPRTIVLLPAHHVLITVAPTLDGHAQNLRNIPRAASYAVEEQLAESAEEVHSAVGGMRGSQASVAVIRDALMRTLMRELDAAELAPDVVTSEALLLPHATGEAFLLIDNNGVLFRLSDTIASRLERDVFVMFFEQYLAQTVTDLPTFSTLQVRAMRETPADFIEQLRALCQPHGITITSEQVQGGTFDWLCQQWPEVDPINLLQGPYGSNSGQAFFPNLKAVAVVLALWFVLQVAFDIGSTIYLNDQAEQLHAQSESIYRRLFPADTRIVDLKTQFLQHRNNNSSTAQGFTQLLSVLAGGMSQAPRPEIETLHYDAAKNELLLDMIASDFTSLESFKHLDGDVTVGSAVKEEHGVRAQVRIHDKNAKESHG